jgi:hypothetical protein
MALSEVARLALQAALDDMTAYAECKAILENSTVNMYSTTSTSKVVLTTNLDDALSVEDSVGDLVSFNTTTGSNAVTFTPAVTFTGGVKTPTTITFTGATGVPEVILPNNLAEALSIRDVANNNLIVLDTRTGANVAAITPNTTVAGTLTVAKGVTLTSDATLSGTLGVAKAATFTSDAAFSSTATFNGNIIYETSTGVTACGGTASNTAFQLLKGSWFNINASVASGGVILHTGVQGDKVNLLNSASNVGLIFPAAGGTINGSAANWPYLLTASKGAECYCTAADTWVVFEMGAKATTKS